MESRREAVGALVPTPALRTVSRAACLAVALLLAPQAFGELPSNPSSDRVAPLRAQAIAQAATPQGLIALQHLYALKLELAQPDGFVDLGAALRPNRDATAFAAADLDVARDLRVVIHLGASGASKLFVDGTKVLEDKQYHPAVFDQRAVAVDLKKGTHHLLLKLAHEDGAMGFYLRISGPK